MSLPEVVNLLNEMAIFILNHCHRCGHMVQVLRYSIVCDQQIVSLEVALVMRVVLVDDN